MAPTLQRVQVQYRPSGPLLRMLRIERWLCPGCQRDNLLRRETMILNRPCRWCGANLWPFEVAVKTWAQQLNEAMASAVDAVEAVARWLAQSRPNPNAAEPPAAP